MRFREYGRRFFKTAPGIVSVFLSIASGFFVFIAGGRIIAAFAVAVLCQSGLFSLGILTGLGARAAASEADREARQKAGLSRSETKAACERLAALRLADLEIGTARDLLVLEAKRYLELVGDLYDPAAAAAVLDSLELVQAWLREADETAIERRFSGSDTHAFPEAKARVTAALREKTAIVVRGRDAIARGISGPDLVSIEEELR